MAAASCTARGIAPGAAVMETSPKALGLHGLDVTAKSLSGTSEPCGYPNNPQRLSLTPAEHRVFGCSLLCLAKLPGARVPSSDVPGWDQPVVSPCPQCRAPCPWGNPDFPLPMRDRAASFSSLKTTQGAKKRDPGVATLSHAGSPAQ